MSGMECNKDEAVRAKEIAEKKFKLKDIAGAKKFALKAQSLYPEIEGVSQMLATLDVYIAAEKKVNHDLDWYGILNANPHDDNETLKKKYRKLALILHPDKNKSVGAEGAFKHVSEAWKFLSDKEKRAAYDRRRSLHTVYPKVSVSSSYNGFCNFANTTSTTAARTTNQKNNPTTQKNNPTAQKNNPMTPKNNQTTQKNNQQKPVGNTQRAEQTDHSTTTPASFTASQSSDQSKSNSFWTVCRRCMMQYEYLRVYVNCNLMCPNCLQSFSAVEVPKSGISSRWSSCSRLKQNLDPRSAGNHNSTSGLFNNSKWTFSRTSSAAHAASVVQQAYEKVKKEREEAKAKREKKNAKRKNTTDSSASGGALKKRKVRGETDTSFSSGKKVCFCVTNEIERNMRKLERGSKERADRMSPRRMQKTISKEDVTIEIKSC